jgi:hypothetical protein
MPDHVYPLNYSKVSLIPLAFICLINGLSLYYFHCSLALKLLFIAGVFAYTYYFAQRYFLLTSPRAVTTLRRLADGRWLISQSQQTHVGHLLADSLVTPLMCILRFRVHPSKWARPMVCLVWFDSLAGPHYRHLIRTLNTLDRK